MKQPSTMLRGIIKLILFIAVVSLIPLSAKTSRAQSSLAEFQRLLREKESFSDADLAKLQEGQTVVKVRPAQDKREVAVSGLVGLQVPADVFLKSYRESVSRKSSSAILEIGRFSNQPVLEDLKDLTFEDRDIEDLKTCVVGNCRLKLSATMIERLHRELDWNAPDYANRASELLKVMLLDYVREYLARGDLALIEYSDKARTVRLADEHRALKAGSSYLHENFMSAHLKGLHESKLQVENVLVWSKIKFGLKPVLAINHITIYQNQKEAGPQVLVTSKQIYANHYFDSSLALTAFVNIPGANPQSYLFYENRSRADGLGGMFGKIKRGLVEDRAVQGLKAILEQSRSNLNASLSGEPESAASVDSQPGWKRWKGASVRLLSWLLLITTFFALLAFSNYYWKGTIRRGTS